MRFTVVSLVGIGTSNPSGKLQVAGDEVRIGDAGTLNYASADGDLYVEDALEVDGNAYLTTLFLGGTQVTSTAAELNYLDGTTVTSGGITFGNGTYMTQDTPNFFWADSTNRLGIGTSNPSYKLDVVSSDTTAALSLTADSVTTGTAALISVDGLTQGTGLSIASTSTALSTGKLLSLDWSPTGSTEIYATGDLFSINIGQYGNVGNLFKLTDNGSNLFSVSQSAITSGVPHSFTATGDVSIAYDLVFTNQTASTIDTYGPLTIQAGESFENNNLTLKTFGTGDLIFDNDGATTVILTDDGKVGIGTATPSYALQLSTDSAAKPTSNTWTIASDVRLKKEILAFDDGLDVLKQINPVSYKLNGLADLPMDAAGIGIIAQDMIGAAPYTIKTFTAKLNPGDTEETQLYAFDSSALTFVTINAVKELDLKLSGLDIQLLTNSGVDSSQAADIQRLKDTTVTSLNSLQTGVDTLNSQVLGLNTEISALKGQLAAINELLGTQNQGEASQSSESTQSTAFVPEALDSDDSGTNAVDWVDSEDWDASPWFCVPNSSFIAASWPLSTEISVFKPKTWLFRVSTPVWRLFNEVTVVSF